MSVRVRFAPSPTGLMHIGNVRTALFDYFFAKSSGGKFIVRVEDTDQERYSNEALNDLYETFKWLGTYWDEGPDLGGDFAPYTQSERKDLYNKYVKELIDSGSAYYCYCSPQRLNEVREQQQKEKKKVIGYDRHCRELSDEQRKNYSSKGITPVVRFKIPFEGKTIFHDELLGDVARRNVDVSPDPVIMKSDGFPTYHLAHVVDDHLMEITHVLRSQEWLPSGPLHLLMFKAFGWNPPKYYHLPMVLGKDGKKLSKRHGSTSMKDFREAGYLPEALINYISMVGWSFDDSREFFTKEELEKLFSMDKLNKASGVFDYKKLLWFNGQYIRKKTDKEFIKLIIPFLAKDGIIGENPTDHELKIIDDMVPIIKPRLKLLSEVSQLTAFLFKEVEITDPLILIPKKMEKEGTIKILEVCKEILLDFDSKSDEENEEIFKTKAEELEVKLGSMLMPLRVAMSGSSISPPLFGTIRLIGTDLAINRVNKAINLLINN